MLITFLLLTIAALVGLWIQRDDSDRAHRLRDRLWSLNYVLFIPLAAVYALLAIDFAASLVALIACWIAAWWACVALAGAWAHVACRSAPARGAAWLAGAFPNTGFLGFPLAYLAFGSEGLQYAIIYDQVSLVIPAVVVSTMIARRHAPIAGEPGAVVATAIERESLLRTALVSPPLWTVLVVVALRLTTIRDPIELDLLGAAIGQFVGPFGFFLLGLSIPLGGYTHHRRRVVAALGAVLVRIVIAPLALLAGTWACGIELPPALLLIAAMPTAFHALIIGRIEGLDAELLRLSVVVSSIVVVFGTIAYVAW